MSRQQHTQPCSECPWRRKSPPGWLGSQLTPEEWCQAAHSEARIPCHRNMKLQCAGAAIFRSNICKRPHDLTTLLLPEDRERVFSWDDEFIKHHRKLGIVSSELKD